MNVERKSSIIILAACLLWAFDLLVRYPITLEMSFVSIVFIESFLGLLFVFPLMIRDRAMLMKLSRTDWLLALFIGGIGMTVAGYLQTAGIQKATPGLFSFFQIFQPLFVIYIAHLFLKERIDNLYVYWGVWVVLSAILMFSVDLEIMFSSSEFILSDVIIALTTMLIWGMCTILAKKFLIKHSPLTLVTLRWFFAFIFSAFFLLLEDRPFQTDILFQVDVVARFIFISLIAGLLSMYLYYKGLKNLAAGKVSFMEISYAAFGMIFSAIYTFEGLTFFQLLGASSFFAFIVLMISRDESVSGSVRAQELRTFTKFKY